MTRRWKKNLPEEIVSKLRAANAMLNAGMHRAAELQALETSESTLKRWRAGLRREAVVVGGMKCEEVEKLKHLEDENRRLKHLVANQSLDI